jgi:hypothetical protein
MVLDLIDFEIVFLDKGERTARSYCVSALGTLADLREAAKWKMEKRYQNAILTL